MRHFSSAPKYCRFCAVILLGLLALSLAACDGNRAAASRPAASSTAPDDSTGPVLADISAAYGACLDRCNEQTSLGSLTREGCFTGCAEIRRQTDIRDKVYPSRQACFDDMRTVDLNRDLIIERYQAWCLQQWNHLHKRRGCLDAINVFYTHITADTVCGPNAASMDRAYASGVSVSPLPSPSAAPPAPLPPQPVPTPPLSSGAASAQMPPAARPVPPAVQDTPKYQTASVKKTAKKKAKAPAKAKNVKPEPKAAEKDTPMPELSEPKVAPEPQPVTPEAAVPQSPKTSAPPAAPAQPTGAPAPAPVTPSAQPAPAAMPKAPVAPVQPSPAAPVVPANPIPAAQPQAPAAPAPQVPTPAAPAAQPTPQAAAPAAKAPAVSNSTATQPVPEAQTPSTTLVPVPSMLERAYTSPAVLAPQSQGGHPPAAPLVPPLPPVNQTPPVAP